MTCCRHEPSAARTRQENRPLSPAAFGPWEDATTTPPPDRVPVVSVGATNPNDTVALFSNTGPWVRCYDFGASVLSTLPDGFQSGWTDPDDPPSDEQSLSRRS